MTSRLKEVQSAFGIATSRIAVFSGVLGLAGGGLVASLAAVTMKTIHMGDSLYHASRHLNMATAELQLWGDAADHSGYSAEQFQQSLAVLNRRSAQAFAGQKKGIMGFQALGISVKNASGQLKSNSMLLEEITGKMSKIDNQAQRQHIAALLFGGDGKEMAAMLSQGMEPIKELFEKAQKGGWLIGADVSQYAADLSDKLGAFKKKIGGIIHFIGARFMPVLNDMIDAFSLLIDENRELIQITITEWMQKLRQIMKDLQNPSSDLRQSLTDITEQLKGWFQWMEPLIGEISLFKVGLMALGAFIFGPLIASLTMVGAAFVTLGYTIMTTPIGWILAGMAALIAAGYMLHKHWNKITVSISGLWEGVAQKIDSSVEWLYGISLVKVGAHFIESFWDGIRSKWSAMTEWLHSMVRKLTDWMPDFVKEKLGFNVNINKTSTEVIKNLTDETNARAKRLVNATVVSNIPPEQQVGGVQTGTVKTQYMEAANIKVEAFKVPEPIVINKPSEIDASVKITNLSISGGNGSPQEIMAAVNKALERYARQQRIAIASSLSD
ncbi:Phage tail protein [Bartonella ancashensis]|uniref:Phage tail protein n=2 Tax=Bartonella ancashensis TaxID=1318743 RepID=A0A0M4LHA1_9HYPH|nr:Phage tail protein [Bartonella ancashensis]